MFGLTITVDQSLSHVFMMPLGTCGRAASSSATNRSLTRISHTIDGCATGRPILIVAGRESRGFVAPKGAVLGCILRVSVGAVGLCRVMVAPRRRVSCRRGASLCGGAEADGSEPPDLRGRTARRHRDLDAADADAHERADLEQLETNGAAGGLGELSVVETNTARSAQQDISHRVEPQAELVAPHRGCDPHRGRAGTP